MLVWHPAEAESAQYSVTNSLILYHYRFDMSLKYTSDLVDYFYRNRLDFLTFSPDSHLLEVANYVSQEDYLFIIHFLTKRKFQYHYCPGCASGYKGYSSRVCKYCHVYIE